MQQIDLDGSIYFSPVITVETFGEYKVEVFPTLVQEQINVSVGSDNSEAVRIQIFNLYGYKVLEDRTLTASTGIDVSSLLAGNYFLKVFTGERVFTKQFVKL